MRKIKGSDITAWLTELGYLAESQDSSLGMFKVLTEKSASIGIRKTERTSQNGQVYHINVYSPEAQKFIIDHLDDISNRFE